MPGAELDGLYAFESAGEVLKLLTRVFVHLEGHPAAVRTPVTAGASPTPSILPFHRVELNA